MACKFAIAALPEQNGRHQDSIETPLLSAENFQSVESEQIFLINQVFQQFSVD